MRLWFDMSMINTLQKIQLLFFKPSLSKVDLSLLPEPKIKNWELLTATALLTLLCYGLYDFIRYQTRLNQTSFKLSELNFQQDTFKNKAEALSPEESAALVDAIDRLHYAWDHVFKALEAAKMPEVSILELSPNVQVKQIDIVAQTTSLQMMLEYIKKLKSVPFVSRVVLNSDELQDSQQQPVLFHITLAWY